MNSMAYRKFCSIRKESRFTCIFSFNLTKIYKIQIIDDAFFNFNIICCRCCLSVCLSVIVYTQNTSVNDASISLHLFSPLHFNMSVQILKHPIHTYVCLFNIAFVRALHNIGNLLKIGWVKLV